jgi:hypothetical protein
MGAFAHSPLFVNALYAVVGLAAPIRVLRLHFVRHQFFNIIVHGLSLPLEFEHTTAHVHQECAILRDQRRILAVSALEEGQFVVLNAGIRYDARIQCLNRQFNL